MRPMHKCSSIHLVFLPQTNKRSGVMCYVLNNYASLHGRRRQPALQTGLLRDAELLLFPSNR